MASSGDAEDDEVDGFGAYKNETFISDNGIALKPQTSEPLNFEEQSVSMESIRLASVLIRDAQSGHRLKRRDDKQAIRLYCLYKHPVLTAMTYLAVVILFLLFLFEKPAMKELEFSPWIGISIELVVILFFVFRLVHNASFCYLQIFFKDKKNITVIIVLILFVCDVISYVVWTQLQGTYQYAIRWSRPLRPFLMINLPHMYQLRRALRNLRRTLLRILPVMALFFFFICLYTLLGVKLLARHELVYPSGEPYFNNLFETAWALFVLITTANNPDVMLPAYNYSKWFSIYFVSFMLINYFLISNILLAVVYVNYRDSLRNEVKKSIHIRQQTLTRAFNLVAVRVNDQTVINTEIWTQLFQEYSPNFTPHRVKFLFDIVREDSEFIHLQQFLKLADLLNIQIVEHYETRLWCSLYIPRIYDSYISNLIKKGVRHRFFKYTFHLLIVVNAICIGFNIEEAEWFFMSLFSLEIILKLYVHGVRRFFRSKWNLFDFFIIIGAIIATIVKMTNQIMSDTLLTLRVLRLLKLLGTINQFKVIITTIFKLTKSFAIYCLLIWVFYYPFAIIGMELFANSYHYDENSTFCGNILLNRTDFAELNYCNVNFNDAISACMFLFHLLIVNQWHVITSGLVTISTNWAMLYTISFILMFTFLILNIVIAFVIEIFLLELKFDKNCFESRIDQKIKRFSSVVEEDDTSDLRQANYTTPSVEISSENVTNNCEGLSAAIIHFRLSKNSTKNTETLLQQMFEDELGSDSNA